MLVIISILLLNPHIFLSKIAGFDLFSDKYFCENSFGFFLVGAFGIFLAFLALHIFLSDEKDKGKRIISGICAIIVIATVYGFLQHFGEVFDVAAGLCTGLFVTRTLYPRKRALIGSLNSAFNQWGINLSEMMDDDINKLADKIKEKEKDQA